MVRTRHVHALLLALASPAFAGHGDLEPVDFNRDVRPILSQNCFACHGPDEAVRAARLRLDVSTDAQRARGILIPNQPAASALLARVLSEDADERMPPPDSNRTLAPADTDILRRWIAEGASYDVHWSFRPVAAPPVPLVEPTSQVVTPQAAIDAFLTARLVDAGLSPAPPADRRTLLRRVTFDLTGLPPTPAELAAFEADEHPEAWERVVDRLLASPAHAERMALAWMDAARYGDTSVFHADGPREMWPWRDWVIEAYRSNMPFDRFTIEQLAGDLLPDATRAQRIASGFLRNNGSSDEGGAIDEELRVSYMIDRVKTTGNVWLGLSIECAQCHDHKFDPLTSEDYYSFFAYFNQSSEKGFQTRNGNELPLEQVPDDEQESELARLDAALGEHEDRLAALQPPVDEFAAWLDGQRATVLALEIPQVGPWHALLPFRAASSAAAFAEVYVDPSAIDLAGTVVAPDDGERAWQEQADFADGQVNVLGLPDNSAGYLARTVTFRAPARRELSLGSDDTLRVWLNGVEVLANESYRGAAPDQDLLQVDFAAGENELLLEVCNGGGPAGFYFELRGSGLPEDVEAALRTEAGARSDDERVALSDYYVRSVWPAGVARVAELEQLRAQRAELDAAVPTVMVMADADEPRRTYVLERGQYDAPNLNRPVEPGVPSFLPPLADDASPDRLGLARWLVRPDHPLTARVAVNRTWAMLFGKGLVASVMDFGSQGTWPSHPQLLDWLAADFVASGWDVRRLLKALVMTEAYQRSSHHAPERVAADPTNRLLARAPRFRLQGEFLRDQALAVSGLLVDTVGGPGVRPYQPAGLWNEVSLDKNVRFEQDHGEALYRKSLYIYWKRSAPMPAMTIFDAPTREKCVVQRSRTNTPLQALVTLNDVQFVEAARHLAARMLRAGDDFRTRLDHGFEACTARPADDLRADVLRAIHDAQLVEFRAAPEQAAALLAVGESERDAGLDVAEHATWTVLASMLFNLDETLTRE